MQDDNIETSAERSEYVRPSPYISSHAKARELERESDGGHIGDERQGVRDLSKIRGKRYLPMGQYRNKPRGWRQSGRPNKAQKQKPLRKRNCRIEKRWSKRNHSGR